MCPPLRLGTSSLWAAKSCHTLALRRNAWVRTRAILTSDPLYSLGFPGGVSGKESAGECRRRKRCRSIPGPGRSPGEGNVNPLQYSCLENPMDRGDWQATVHEVARVRHNLATKLPPPPYLINIKYNKTSQYSIHLKLTHYYK